MLNIKQLNDWADEILSGNLLDTYAPTVGDLSNSVQVLDPKMGDAFQLTLVAGGIKPVTKETIVDPSVSAIIRVPISYSKIIKLQDNKKKFLYELCNTVNYALGALVTTLGNLEGREVFCHRPGESNVYLREMEASAAVELRFFCTHKQIKIYD